MDTTQIRTILRDLAKENKEPIDRLTDEAIISRLRSAKTDLGRAPTTTDDIRWLFIDILLHTSAIPDGYWKKCTATFRTTAGTLSAPRRDVAIFDETKDEFSNASSHLLSSTGATQLPDDYSIFIKTIFATLRKVSNSLPKNDVGNRLLVSLEHQFEIIRIRATLLPICTEKEIDDLTVKLTEAYNRCLGIGKMAVVQHSDTLTEEEKQKIWKGVSQQLQAPNPTLQ
jgi:hypothetical protein